MIELAHTETRRVITVRESDVLPGETGIETVERLHPHGPWRGVEVQSLQTHGYERDPIIGRIIFERDAPVLMHPGGFARRASRSMVP